MIHELAIHTHPLNQAADQLLKSVNESARSKKQMAAIALALETLARNPNPADGEKLATLHRWDSDPRWQALALLMLEKDLTPQQLLSLSPAEAGLMIAEILIETSASNN